MTSLFQLHAKKWKTCTACDYCHGRKNVVLARGCLPCDVLFIGEAPGPSEDVLAQPFVGPAGKLLDSMLAEALRAIPNGDKMRVGFSNLVACIPKKEQGDKFAEPSPESIAACDGRLAELFEMAQARLVFCAGKLAWKRSPSWHLEGTKLIEIVHPAAMLPGRMDVSQRGLAIQRCIATITDALYDLPPF